MTDIAKWFEQSGASGATELERIRKIHAEDCVCQTARDVFYEEVYFRTAHRHRATLLSVIERQTQELAACRAELATAIQQRMDAERKAEELRAALEMLETLTMPEIER